MSKKSDVRQEVLDRLLLEVRQQAKIISDLRKELSTYQDMHSLTLRGAIAYLIKQKMVLDSIETEVRKSVRYPEKSDEILSRIEKILDDNN